MPNSYKFNRLSKNTEIMAIQKQIEDNYFRYKKDVEILPVHSMSKKGYVLKSDGNKAVWDTIDSTQSLPTIPGGAGGITALDTHMADTSTHGVNEVADKNEMIAMSVALGMP